MPKAIIIIDGVLVKKETIKNIIIVRISVLRLFWSPQVTWIKEFMIEIIAQQNNKIREWLKNAIIPIIDAIVENTPEIFVNIFLPPNK